MSGLMEVDSISRSWIGPWAAIVTLGLWTSPALADVLEVGSGGAQWIARGHAKPGSLTTLTLGPSATAPAVALTDPGANTPAIPEAYVPKVQELSARYGLSPALIEAVVWQESRWHVGAVSPAGARGLAQLMPSTAQSLGVDPDDPLANLEGGVRYLRAQLDRFGGDLEKALAAYNAGPGRVERAGGVPPIRETQTYVAAILGRLSEHDRR